MGIGVATASATIRDDDPLRVNLSGDKAVTEGNPASYTLELVGGLGSENVTATWRAGAASDTATITAGQQSGTFEVPTASGDAPDTLSVSLVSVNTAAGRVSRGTSSASTRIVATGTVIVSLEPPAAAAEDGTFNFTVETAGTPSGNVLVRYATATGTASSADFDSTSGILTITSSGNTPVPVTVEDDTLAEDSETFSMTLSLVSPRDGSVVLGADRATATINDNDPLTATVTRQQNTVLEGADATFLVALTLTGGTASRSGSRPVIVSYRPTAASTAEAPDDYTSPSGKLTIPAGRSSGTITISTKTDDVLELSVDGTTRGGETLAVELTAATTAAGAVTASSTASDSTNIRDHDGFVVVSAADAAAVDEGDAAVFTVSLSGQVSYPVTMAVGPTAATVDYEAAAPATLTIAAEETSGTVTVQTIDDTLAEDEEPIPLTLSDLAILTTPATTTLNGTVVLGASMATGTIRKNDPLRVNLSGPRAVIVSAATNVEYTLELTGGTTETDNVVTVDYAYRVGSDSGTGTTTIAGGSQTGTFSVTPAGPSAGQTLVVTLTDVEAVRGTVTRGTASVSTAVAETTISATDQTATAETGNLEFTVTSTPGIYGVVSYQTSGGTASSSADYTSQSGRLTFGSISNGTTTPGSSAGPVTVTVVDDDLNEANETFNLRLSWVSGDSGVRIATPTVKGTINDDDTLTASVASGQTTVPEGSPALFVVTLADATSTAPVVVNYDLVGSTATAENGDYTAPSGKLTISRGASTGTISIATLDDGVLDRAEMLQVTLRAATSAGTVEIAGAPETRRVPSSAMPPTGSRSTSGTRRWTRARPPCSRSSCRARSPLT